MSLRGAQVCRAGLSSSCLELQPLFLHQLVEGVNSFTSHLEPASSQAPERGKRAGSHGDSPCTGLHPRPGLTLAHRASEGPVPGRAGLGFLPLTSKRFNWFQHLCSYIYLPSGKRAMPGGRWRSGLGQETEESSGGGQPQQGAVLARGSHRHRTVRTCPLARMLPGAFQGKGKKGRVHHHLGGVQKLTFWKLLNQGKRLGC